MSKKLITFRIPEELLEKKPENLSISDWIRECIHLWILENEKTKDQITTQLEKVVKKIEKIKVEVNTEELERALSELEKITSNLDETLSNIRSLSSLEIKIKEMIEQINESLICKIEKYNRW